jgi:transformation/transcription domain-associated protein
MTPNIQSLIGELLLNGRFIPSMGIIAAAIEEAQDELDPALRLLLRDDIVAWYTSKSMAKSDAKMQELEKQLIDRVVRNAIQVQANIAECVPQISKGPEENRRKEPVDVKVRNLVKEATDPKRLCMMPSSYQAWL